MILNIKNVSLNYAKRMAFAASRFKLTGTVVTMIGANGAGKSTILKALSGLVRINSGKYGYSGKRIDGLSPTNIVKMGIVHVPRTEVVSISVGSEQPCNRCQFMQRQGFGIRN